MFHESFDILHSSMPTQDWFRLNRDNLPAETAARMEAMLDIHEELRGRHNDVWERIADLEHRLDYIADAITCANWRTGKKSELKDLIEDIAPQTGYEHE